MTLRKSTLAALLAACSLAVTVGCNEKEDRKKGNGKSGDPVVQEEVEKTGIDKCEEEGKVASLDKRVQLNTALATFSTVSNDSVSCDSDSEDYNAIVRYKLDTNRTQSTIVDRIGNNGSSLEAVEAASSQIANNMVKTANFDCNLVVIKQVAEIMQSRLSSASEASCEAYAAEFEKAEAVIAAVEARHKSSSQASALATNREQRDWNYDAETHAMAHVALNDQIEKLSSIKSDLESQYEASCESDSGSPPDCSDDEAKAMAEQIEAFVSGTNSSIDSGIYSIVGPGDSQVNQKSDAIIELVAQATGLYVTAQEVKN
ncbi:MAG: hypothetical protein AAF202_08385 [Pseudomonadota bacterium]